MTLQKSDPTSYDNNYTLMQNLLKNKQRTLSEKVESRGIVYQLLARFLQRAQIKMVLKDNRIEEAIHYIRKHINETIELGVLAEKSGLSKDLFIRLFKKETGDTPLRYIYILSTNLHNDKTYVPSISISPQTSSKANILEIWIHTFPSQPVAEDEIIYP